MGPGTNNWKLKKSQYVTVKSDLTVVMFHRALIVCAVNYNLSLKLRIQVNKDEMTKMVNQTGLITACQWITYNLLLSYFNLYFPDLIYPNKS